MKAFLSNFWRQSSRSVAEQEKWQQKITPLSQRAFELAVARWKYGTLLDENSLAEALRLQEELRSIASELRECYPEVYRIFSSTISEALLDYKYAISAPQATSLRLHHYIESQPGRGGSVSSRGEER